MQDYGKPREYVELHAHSSHSLLDGVPSPQELVTRAAEYGMPALALTDHDGLYGAVPFIRAAEAAGIKPLLGAELTLVDASHLLLLAETPEGYANLCHLITLAHDDQPKGTARLDPNHLRDHHAGLIALSGCREGIVARPLRAGKAKAALDAARHYASLFGPDNFFIELQRHYHPGEAHLVRDLRALARQLGLGVVATGNVHYLQPEQREIHDILTCIRLHLPLDQAGDHLRANDEYIFRRPEAMTRLFADSPDAIATTHRIAERCASASTFLVNHANPAGGHQALPLFPTPDGSDANTYLRRLCEQAMGERYAAPQPLSLLDKELAIIQQLDLANYFLIVADIVHFSRSQGIRCQGRGSAANSLVAYLLNISPIDPIAIDLVFERFLSPERPAPPDIDIDFAADRREEVIQYVYERYGRDYAGMACTLVTFRARSAVRDTARALGFPQPVVERLADVLDLHDERSIIEAEKAVSAVYGATTGVERDASQASDSLRTLLRLAPRLEGLPRHLGIHNGGMILSGPPLSTVIPLEPATMPDRTVVQWDKEALEDARMIKVDLLGLRMLAAIEDAVTLVETLTGQRPELDRLTPDDPAVYDMLCSGKTVGVFQVESRAQASLIPNFKPRCFADLAIQIALIRPGPLQANMVRPYLHRREGRAPVQYLHPLLKPALEETLGVIVFQEQVLKIARDMAGFTPGEGDQLRRALGNKRAGEATIAFRDRFISGACARKVPKAVAEKVFEQLQAFGGYAFAKSHAAAFAVLTYQSSWLRHYYPAAFFAALLRHQPMGFYPSHVIVAEARRSGVEIRAVDVTASDVGATLEPVSENAQKTGASQGYALRLGLESVRGLGTEAGTAIVKARAQGAFRSLADLCSRTGLGRRALEALIMTGALDRWSGAGAPRPRRQLLWELQAALQEAKSSPVLGLAPKDEPTFAALPHHERLWLEQTYAGATAEAHITALVARQLRQMGATPSNELSQWPNGTHIRIGGVVIARQRPPTAQGIAFLAVEDEHGIINVVLQPEIVDVYRRAMAARFLIVEGQIRRDGASMSVVGSRLIPLVAGDRE